MSNRGVTPSRQATAADGVRAAPVGRRSVLLHRWLPLTLLLAAGGVLTGTFLLWRIPSSQPDRPARPLPESTATLEYIGSQACAACHRGEYEIWSGSQHARAMQPASPTTVLGDFDDSTYSRDGVVATFFRRDGGYFVHTEGPGGELGDFAIRYTFGVEPLQQYLVELPRGRLQALSIAWDSRPGDEGGQRWFHLYPQEHIEHTDELHWTGRQQNWNYMCADCHSTDVRKNYDPANDGYATTWSEISVGCEACHGPGSRHAELARLAGKDQGWSEQSLGLTVRFDERRDVVWAIDPQTGNARRSQPRPSDTEISVCAQCHSRRAQIGDGHIAGAPFTDHYLPSLLIAGLYYPDGQQRDEVYKWGSFLSSRMYAQGVTCSDCHEPHGQRLRAEGNAICAQCHVATKYDVPAHHFHEQTTAGARCASCHMMATDYMVIDPRHDHSMRIPRPDLSARLGVPNACNACHVDRDAAWAVARIRERYPRPNPGYQTFADALHAADAGAAGAAAGLLATAADPAQSAIARASALARLAGRPTPAVLEAAVSALDDPSALVRSTAVGLLEMLPPGQRTIVARQLADPDRSVRMAAANLLAPLSPDLTGSLRADFERAASEFIAAQRFNADRPEYRTNLGTFLAMRGSATAAAAEFDAALALDRQFVPAWVNLADLRRSEGREADAESLLREALESVPEDPTLHHSLGLSLVRQSRYDEALQELAAATSLAPDNARFAYVHGVALQSTGRLQEAVAALESALERNPNDYDLLAALVSILRDAGEFSQAGIHARRLLDAYPDDPAAGALMQSLSVDPPR